MCFVAGLVLACLQRQEQPQMWDCRSVVSSSRRKKFKISPAPEEKCMPINSELGFSFTFDLFQNAPQGKLPMRKA